MAFIPTWDNPLPGFRQAQAQYDAMTPPEFETEYEWEQEIERLLSPGGECFPFTVANVQESLELAIPESVANWMLAATMAEEPQLSEIQRRIGIEMMQHVSSYWHAEAENQADAAIEIRNTPPEE